MDYLRQSVALRGYAQKNPKQEYKREAFELFHRMLDEYKREITSKLSMVQVRDAEQVDEAEASRAADQPTNVTYEHEAMGSALADDAATQAPQSEAEQAIAAAAAARSAASSRQQNQAAEQPTQPFVRGEKTGRNDPCPCGSGKKFKQCHGKLS